MVLFKKAKPKPKLNPKPKPRWTPGFNLLNFYRGEKIRYGDVYFSKKYLVDFYIAENNLRELLQHEDTLQHYLRYGKKGTVIESTADLSEKANEDFDVHSKLQDIRVKIFRADCQLYDAEWKLPLHMKRCYDQLRGDPKWFMRKNLVNGCKENDGCCGRDCGCCERRSELKGTKGSGHCTIECQCCAAWRGFEISHEDKEKLKQKFIEMLNHEAYGFILNLSTGFFTDVYSICD